MFAITITQLNVSQSFGMVDASVVCIRGLEVSYGSVSLAYPLARHP